MQAATTVRGFEIWGTRPPFRPIRTGSTQPFCGDRALRSIAACCAMLPNAERRQGRSGTRTCAGPARVTRAIGPNAGAHLWCWPSRPLPRHLFGQGVRRLGTDQRDRDAAPCVDDQKSPLIRLVAGDRASHPVSRKPCMALRSEDRATAGRISPRHARRTEIACKRKNSTTSASVSVRTDVFGADRACQTRVRRLRSIVPANSCRETERKDPAGCRTRDEACADVFEYPEFEYPERFCKPFCKPFCERFCDPP